MQQKRLRIDALLQMSVAPVGPDRPVSFHVSMIAIAAGFLGAMLVLRLGLNQSPAYNFWLAGAVLMALLYLYHPRHWWRLLFALLLGCLIAGAGEHMLVTTAWWFFTSSVGAMTGAWILKKIGGAHCRFENAAEVKALFSAAIGAALVSTILDAAMRALLVEGSYDRWSIWISHFLAGIYTTVTIVPALILLSSGWTADARHLPPWKSVELGLLALASLGVVMLILGGYWSSNGDLAFLFAPWLLPYWAALRFSPAIVSMITALLAFSILSAAAYGRGPFSAVADYSEAIEIQVFLIFALSPALLLASVERERRNNQGLARRNEERLELALDAAQMGTWDWDVSADRVTLCEASKKMFGHLSSKESFSIRAFLDVVHADDRTMLLHVLTSAIEGAGVYEVEFRMLSHDQEVRWIMGKGKVVTDVRSHTNRLVGVHLDITARKRIEEREQELRRKLVHRSRVAMLGEISGAIAHELNQPLNAILMNAQASQIDLKSATVHVPVIEEALKDIINAEKRAANVIQGIRALIKKNHLRFHPVVVNDLLREVLYLQRADLTSKGVSVDLKLAEPLAKVEGDQVQLQQVFVNLISNACDAMATDSTTDRRIIVETEQVEDSNIQIRISDQGGGIPEDKIGQVFEPFFSTKAHGLGLGLSICRTIVSLHRGRMWSMNNSRGGVTFYISLPIAVENLNTNRESRGEI